jgi:hypothetical protein
MCHHMNLYIYFNNQNYKNNLFKNNFTKEHKKNTFQKQFLQLKSIIVLLDLAF